MSMTIAVVAPSPVPFMVGGAEKLWWGLQEYINKNTQQHCELIKVSSPEQNFKDLIASYHRFYTLDVSHFDLVLSTKYPAWMVQHPNHHVYMQHTLRGLYELYYGPVQLPGKCPSYAGVKKILNCISDNNRDIERLLDLSLELAEDSSAPGEALDFPGPLLVRIIHALDHWGLERVRKISAISKTVKSRIQYFPDNAQVEVIYHPSNLEGFRDTGREYLLTASRLVSPKRVDMILRAYLDSGVDIPLKIAGQGPELSALKTMASGNPNVEFTGFVSDRELAALYAGALAVIFIPENEDFGLITLEAMLSAKPVITFTDSGGPTELVEHEKTGWICSPDVGNLTGLLKKVVSDPVRVMEMGALAREKVAGITWENLAYSLFGPEFSSGDISFGAPVRSKRPKLTVLSTFAVYPPKGGGQVRIYNLYRELATRFDVRLLCLTGPLDCPGAIRLASGFEEIKIPVSPEFQQEAVSLSEDIGIPATDLAVMLFPELLEDFAGAVEQAAADSDLIIVSHPYTLPLVRKCTMGRLVHEAHNVEYDLKKSVLRQSPRGKDVLNLVCAIEEEACKSALCTMACSAQDLLRLQELYGLDPARAIVVPNGVDPDACAFVSPVDRAGYKAKLGLENSHLALFLGSYHYPNIEAVKFILEIAYDLPQYCFIIIGSVGNYFMNKTFPKNIGFTGEIGEKEKALYLACADVALNPMLSGSGTNLKMFEYIASGLPVISTHFGARGLDNQELPVIKVSEDRFGNALSELAMNPERVYKGRKIIEKSYSWHSIAGAVARHFYEQGF
jgi:glycosyltransferase involved in cell wall biosynthesis